MLRIICLVLGLAYTSQGAGISLGPKRLPGPPNIILIMADDLGYGDLGCYGQEKILTPQLDKLAQEGMRFIQAYAGSTVCAPSRSALMTGLHTGHTRVRGNQRIPLLPEDITIAEVLQQRGYLTGIFGKWGLGNEGTTGIPNKQGFQEWFGYLDQEHAHNYYPTELWRNERRLIIDKNQYNYKQEYSHDWFTRSALNFVRINKYKPFFLYLAYTIPHANNALGRATGNGMEVPSDEPYSKKEWPQPEKNKAAMITRLDRDIGLLMQALKQHKIDEHTLVIFTSDNGPHKEGGINPKFFNSSGGLRGIKRDLYEGGIRVPMIARWPGKVLANSVSHQVVTGWDFFPTAAEVSGASYNHEIDGISYVPTLMGRKQEQQHKFLYWEFHEGGSKQAVRMGKWKGIRLAPGAELELYNLDKDLKEQNNIASQHPEIVKQIEAYLKNARTESEHWPLKSPPAKQAATKKNP